VTEREEGAKLGFRSGYGREEQAMPAGREREQTFPIYFIFLSLFQCHFKSNLNLV